MMEIKKNKLKTIVKNKSVVYGVWNGLVDSIVGEIVAGAGFDWIVIDGEHAPFDLRTILNQLQAIAAYDVPVIVRPPSADVTLIKQLMDVGVQTLIIPMVETTEQANSAFRAMQYPPVGTRGIGTGVARAARWNNVKDYFEESNREMSLIVQVETVAGIGNLDEILKTDGVEGVFIGPADLSASMGLIGQPDHEKVRSEIEKAIKKIRSAGKVAGIMALTKNKADEYKGYGANMIAIGVDTLLLSTACQQLMNSFK